MKTVLRSVVFIILLSCIMHFREVATSIVSALHKPLLSLPVTVTYRDATVGNSRVAQFHNNSNEALTIKITWIKSDKGFFEAPSETVTLWPGEMKEQGWLEGWEFHSGDSITISNSAEPKSYTTVTSTVR
jgi:hypothetical protein